MISVRNGLDRETIAEYNLTVTAIDVTRIEMRSRTLVNVRVSDVNDNAPIFANTTYTVDISESMSIGTEVIVVTATDDDVDKRVQYRLHQSNDANGKD